jgi:hypothetical protein
MGGSSKTTSASTVPAWVSQAQQDALARANAASRIGNVGYYGPDVAAMTPSQIAAIQGTNMAASAFGQPTVDVTAGMPTATDYGGMNAYSSGAGYDAALAELKARFPGQFEAIMSQFVDRVTGAMPGATGSGQTQMGMPVQKYAPVYGNGSGGGGGGGGGGSTGGGSGSGVGGRSLSDLAMIAGSYLPGGMNTNRPFSLLNTIAADVRNAISPQRAPTSADRPPPSPNRPAGITTSKITTSKPAAFKPGSTRF